MFYSRLFFIVLVLGILGCNSAEINEHQASSDSTAWQNPVFAGVDVLDSVKRDVWKRDEGKCTLCQGTHHLGYYHRTLPSKGGTNTWGNLEVRCEMCSFK